MMEARPANVQVNEKSKTVQVFHPGEFRKEGFNQKQLSTRSVHEEVDGGYFHSRKGVARWETLL